MNRAYLAILALSLVAAACGQETKKETTPTGVSPEQLAQRDNEIKSLRILIDKLQTTHSSDLITISALNDRLRAMEAVKEQEEKASLEAQYGGKPGVDFSNVGQGTEVELGYGEYLGGQMVFPTGRFPLAGNRAQGPLITKRKSALPDLPEMNLYITLENGKRAKILDSNRFQLEDGTILTSIE